jgi:hypothetical protein
VFGPDGRLLYMSRKPIPSNKKQAFEKAMRQVCAHEFQEGVKGKKFLVTLHENPFIITELQGNTSVYGYNTIF